MKEERYYRRVPNFNLAPRALFGVSFLRLVLPAFLILMLVEAFFIYGLYQEKSAHGSAVEVLKQDLSQVQQKLGALNAKKAQAQELRATIDALRGQIEALGKLPEVGALSEVMASLLEARPTGVRVTSIEWRKGEVGVEGTASGYAALLEYRGRILASPGISSIPSFTSQEKGDSISFSLVVQVRGKGE